MEPGTSTSSQSSDAHTNPRHVVDSAVIEQLLDALKAAPCTSEQSSIDVEATSAPSQQREASAGAADGAKPSSAPVATLSPEQFMTAAASSSAAELSPVVCSATHVPHATDRQSSPQLPMHGSDDVLRGASASTGVETILLSPHQMQVLAAARNTCIPENLLDWAVALATIAPARQEPPPYPESADIPGDVRGLGDSPRQTLSPEEIVAALMVLGIGQDTE